MSRTDTGEASEKLNELGRRWVRNTGNNGDVWESQLVEAEILIIQIAYERVYANVSTESLLNDSSAYDRKMEQLHEGVGRLVAELKRDTYCPEKQLLGKYVNSRLGLRGKDASRASKAEQSKIAYSLDETVNEETETKRDNFIVPVTQSPEQILIKKEERREHSKPIDWKEHLLKTIICLWESVINLQNSITVESGAHKLSRLRNWKICYTEKISCIARRYDLKKLSDESNICAAVYDEYFHYYADCDGKCDSIEKLQESPLKPWDRILADGVSRSKSLDWDEKGLYLPVIVPDSFTRTVLHKTVSVTKIRNDFDAMLCEAVPDELWEALK